MGRFVNKFGNAVGLMWQDINVARIYVDDVANPNTEKQQVVRNRFRVLAQMAKRFRATLITGLLKYARSLTSTIYGTFVSLNWDCVEVSDPDAPIINYSELRISNGACEKPVLGSIVWGTETHLTVEVTFTYPEIADVTTQNDEAYLVLYCPDTNSSLISTPALVSGGGITLECPATWNGMQVYAWLFCVSRLEATNGQASPSIYCGHGELQ